MEGLANLMIGCMDHMSSARSSDAGLTLLLVHFLLLARMFHEKSQLVDTSGQWNAVVRGHLLFLGLLAFMKEP